MPRAAEGQARIVVVSPEGADLAHYNVSETFDLGRSEGDMHLLEEIFASPRHARIQRKERGFVLRDLDSVNGVYLRIPNMNKGASRSDTFSSNGPLSSHQGAPIGGEASHPLQDQDLILLGQQVLKFEEVHDAEGGVGSASQHGVLLFGSPAAPRYARLSLRTVEGVSTDVFHIRKPETTIGRETGDIVFTNDPFMSRRHAVIQFDQQRRFRLLDIGSANGSFVRIRREVALRSGDQFRIGQTLFRFDLGSNT